MLTCFGSEWIVAIGQDVTYTFYGFLSVSSTCMLYAAWKVFGGQEKKRIYHLVCRTSSVQQR
jgi:hypothetical protein